MAEHDLTSTIISYLDRHLAFPLLAHLEETGLFPAEQIKAAQLELALGTNLIDYAANLFQQLHPDQEVPAGAHFFHQLEQNFLLLSVEIDTQRQTAISTHERLQQAAQAVQDVIENPDVVQALRQDKNQNLQYLKDNFNVSRASIHYFPSD